MAKRRNQTRPREEAEIILKQFVQFNCSGRKPLAEPGLLLLSNRAGYRWLAEYFGHLAEREWHSSDQECADPDDHQHLWLHSPPFNPKVSDRMEIRLGVLTPENRRAVKKKYNIFIRAAKRGCLTERYPKDIEVAKRELRTL